jgi:hypothetical protein
MAKVIRKKPIKRDYLFFLVLSTKWKDKIHLWKAPQTNKTFFLGDFQQRIGNNYQIKMNK